MNREALSLIFFCILVIFFKMSVGYCDCVQSTLVPNGAVMAIPKKDGYLPSNFRTLYKNPIIGGLPLRTSGSAQPTPSQMEHLIYYIRTLMNDVNFPLYIVDLRLEPHGYVDDKLIQIHDEGIWEALDPDDADAYNDQAFTTLKHQGNLLIYTDIKKIERQRLANDDFTIDDPLHRIQTEKDVVKNLSARYGNVHYVRLPVMDHNAPQIKVFECFLAFMKTLPKNAWVHFHCAAGRGRTSTFLLLYHMIKGKPKDTIETLFQKHKSMGSIDIIKINTDYKTLYAQNRLNFLRSAFEEMQMKT